MACKVSLLEDCAPCIAPAAVFFKKLLLTAKGAFRLVWQARLLEDSLARVCARAYASHDDWHPCGVACRQWRRPPSVTDQMPARQQGMNGIFGGVWEM